MQWILHQAVALLRSTGEPGLAGSSNLLQIDDILAQIASGESASRKD